MKRLGFIAGLAAGLSIIAAGSGADAAGTAMCRDYASRAVDAARANAVRGCGYGGARWTPSYNVHFEWCRGASPFDVQQETAARAGELAQCGGRPPMGGGGDRCDVYARAALRDMERNLRNGCGLGGPMFNTNYSDHYNWCRSVSPGRAAGEEAARRRLMAQNRC